MLWSWFYLMGWAYLLGVLSSAPLGPVNMLAIHRGTHGRWTHTLACGVGSALVDTAAFAMVLAGGRQLIVRFQTPVLTETLALVGGAVLLVLGGLFLVRARRFDMRALVRLRRRRRGKRPGRYRYDVLAALAMVAINPAVYLYWAGAGSHWIAAAVTELPPAGVWVGLPVAVAGMLSWFTVLAMIIRFTPDRLGPVFFKIVNLICGLVLGGFGLVALGSVVIGRLAPG